MADIEQKYDLDHNDDGTRSPTKLDYSHGVSIAPSTKTRGSG